MLDLIGLIGRLKAPASVLSTDTTVIRRGKAGYEATLASISLAALGLTAGQVTNLALQKVAEVTLTSAQILALNATPITVLAAPGAGFVNIVKRVYATKAAGTAYAGIAAGEDLAIKYTDASGAVAATCEMTGFADSTSATQSLGVGASCLPVANAALVAHMLTGEITTGNSDFKLRIKYETVAVPAF